MTEQVEVVEMLKDKRRISETIWTNGGGSMHEANGFQFVVYGEPGEYCNLPWIAVLKDGWRGMPSASALWSASWRRRSGARARWQMLS